MHRHTALHVPLNGPVKPADALASTLPTQTAIGEGSGGEVRVKYKTLKQLEDVCRRQAG